MSDSYQEPVTRANVSAKADALVGAIEGFRSDLRKVTKDTQKNRWMIWGTIASVAFDILLTLIIFFVADNANSASDKATAASRLATEASMKATEATSQAAESVRTQKVTCEAANISRKLNRDLWDYVLTFSAQNQPEPQTPEEVARNETFRTYISTVFADRDCNNLDEIPVVPNIPTIPPSTQQPSLEPSNSP